MKSYSEFSKAIEHVQNNLRWYSYEVQGARWQSTDVSGKPDMRMKEILNESFCVILMTEDLDFYRLDIEPNLPWADDHFEERVGGEPLNPGVQWANWPWAHSADRHRTEEGGKFSHTYMERYWPAYANEDTKQLLSHLGRMYGIRYPYGDLNDVVNHLSSDPLTRQAYLPVWFPEDTGVVHGERVPCTLGYHFIQRNGYLHTTYYIRSCDFTRHFRDDLYLSVRLLLWVLNRLREKEPHTSAELWKKVKPGIFTFHCVSMHMFVNDWNKLFGPQAARRP